MKKIIAFGASNSKKSINKKFANYAATLIPNSKVELLDLNDYVMPIYSEDIQEEYGIPELAHSFKGFLRESDGIVISFAEYNGSYTAAFKNIFDWISVIERDVWCSKPMLLLATSPGPRGAIDVLESAHKRISHGNKNTVLSFSLPSFGKNYDENYGILDKDLNEELKKIINIFNQSLNI